MIHDEVAVLLLFTSHTDTLSTDDLATLQNALFEVRDKWYHLGVQLKVPISDLKAIRTQYLNNPDDCLLEMLSCWLSNTTPSPTWQTVVDALCCAAIGRQQVADNIRRQYLNENTGIHVDCYIIIIIIIYFIDIFRPDDPIVHTKKTQQTQIQLYI